MNHLKPTFIDLFAGCGGLSQPIKCGILQKLILVARADSKITEYEKEILQSICRDVDIPPTFYEKILSYL